MNKYLILLLFTFLFCNSQTKITANNYYDYYVKFEDASKKGIVGSKITTNWLRKEEVIPIIIEEMKNAGFQHVFDNVLFKIRDNEYIVLSAYSRKSNFGILYVDGHSAKPQKKHREERTQLQEYGSDYTSFEENATGQPKMVHINNFPDNIYFLNENCYWYQYTDNPKDKSKFVSKADAINILRSDIRKYLSKRK